MKELSELLVSKSIIGCRAKSSEVSMKFVEKWVKVSCGRQEMDWKKVGFEVPLKN